ncbi:hypothetical protein HZ326_28229 [Fusarium oxysporum f. sp. albedinis]|nr:hypothetical protein HZ326_28229 [Fusarium oxysporum f. sp. albedinis]
MEVSSNCCCRTVFVDGECTFIQTFQMFQISASYFSDAISGLPEPHKPQLENGQKKPLDHDRFSILSTQNPRTGELSWLERDRYGSFSPNCRRIQPHKVVTFLNICRSLLSAAGGDFILLGRSGDAAECLTLVKGEQNQGMERDEFAVELHWTSPY